MFFVQTSRACRRWSCPEVFCVTVQAQEPFQKSQVGKVHEIPRDTLPSNASKCSPKFLQIPNVFRQFASGQGPHSPSRSAQSSHSGRTIFTRHRRPCNFCKILQDTVTQKILRFCGRSLFQDVLDGRCSCGSALDRRLHMQREI